MAWQDETIPMLRLMIFDLEEVPTYSDTRLEELLLLAAHYISRDMEFANTYTVSFSSCSISPDPINKSEDGKDFMNFMVLKAACLTDQGTYRTKAAAANIKAKFGPAELDTKQLAEPFKILLTEGPCKMYEQAKLEFSYGNTNVIRAVMSPFTNNSFDPSRVGSYGSFGTRR